jgi:hypothetical protein
LLIGSLNLSTSGKIIPSHSIAGALAGGTWASSFGKGVTGSVNRLAAPSWRHFAPVSRLADLLGPLAWASSDAAESLTMGLSLIVYLQPQRAALGRGHTLSHTDCRYAEQRFAWEFLNTLADRGLAIRYLSPADAGTSHRWACPGET